MKNKEKPKHPGGRPSIYTEELADRICDLVATTPKGLATICEENKDIPCFQTICEWRWKKKGFGDAYARARIQQSDILADTLLDLINIEPIYDKEGNKRLDSGTVQAYKNHADHIKWMASQLIPKVWGRNTITLEDGTQDEKMIADVKKARDVRDEKNKKEY